MSVVLKDDKDVVPVLYRLALRKEVLLDIFEKACGERARVNKLDPVESGGVELRRWMTRYLRESKELKELGWVICRHGQIEGIRNDKLEIKVAFTNTDQRTGVVSKQPSNIAKKGARTEELAKNNKELFQESLFGSELDAEDDDRISGYDFWYLCGYYGDDYTSAELSRPDLMSGGFIRNFSNRIILQSPQDGDRASAPVEVPEDFAEIEPLKFSRK